MRTLLVVLALLAAMLLASCGKKAPIVGPTIVREVVTVDVLTPVPFKAPPPPELLAPLTIPLPVFVAPTDPAASSALTAEGERLLRGLIEELLRLRSAWIAWATAP
jgi:hypothetical protein